MGYMLLYYMLGQAVMIVIHIGHREGLFIVIIVIGMRRLPRRILLLLVVVVVVVKN
jgi:hypothetical protein